MLFRQVDSSVKNAPEPTCQIGTEIEQSKIINNTIQFIQIVFNLLKQVIKFWSDLRRSETRITMPEFIFGLSNSPAVTVAW